MLVDLHAHYPMHVVPPEHRDTHARLTAWGRERWRSAIVRVVSRFFNYEGPGDTPAVTLELMREGDVGVVLSVLYEPFDEIDFERSYGAPPRRRYFDDLIVQLEDVEADIAAHRDAGMNVTIAHSPVELAAAGESGQQTLIHAIEGGFHLGADEQEISANVAALAQRGVAYVTVAHLFWREVATNSPALPFLSDRWYHRLFPQPSDEGLTERGLAAVRAMVAHGILVDITHMSERSIADTFATLRAVGDDPPVPVIATHMACRFGNLSYNLSDENIAHVGERAGLLSLIACKHYISNGDREPTSFADSFRLLVKHIDRICEITGSTDHVAFGTDLDGYIKPALPGLEHHGHMRALQDALVDHYGAQTAEKFSSGNALRVLGAAWRRERSIG
jgi:microsomal dipeptidase-like Zn-dependent dipeptidase